MAKRLSNDSSIAEVLQQIIQVNKLQPGIDQIAVKEAWVSLMGNGVNNYTKNVILKGNVLYVELTSAVLREELNHGKSKIVAMVNEELRRDIIKEVVLR